MAAHAAPASSSAVTLRGRCVDGDTGAPLAGCELSLRGRQRTKEALQEYEREHGAVVWTDPPRQTTAADGAFSFS